MVSEIEQLLGETEKGPGRWRRGVWKQGEGRWGGNGAGRRAGAVVCRWAMGYCLWPWTSGLRLEPVLKEVDWLLVRGHLPKATLTDFSLVPVM